MSDKTLGEVDKELRKKGVVEAPGDHESEYITDGGQVQDSSYGRNRSLEDDVYERLADTIEGNYAQVDDEDFQSLLRNYDFQSLEEFVDDQVPPGEDGVVIYDGENDKAAYVHIHKGDQTVQMNTHVFGDAGGVEKNLEAEEEDSEMTVEEAVKKGLNPDTSLSASPDHRNAELTQEDSRHGGPRYRGIEQI